MKNLLTGLIALIFGFVGGFAGMQFFDDPVVSSVREIERGYYVEESQTIDAIEDVMPAVVSITSLRDGASFFGRTRLEVSGGTGFIVSEEGLLLTNRHVVSNEDANYKVLLTDGREFDLEVVSLDPFDDIAVAQIVNPDDEKFPVVRLGDSGSLKVGQKVFAVGNALAQYGNTVTSGIISAQGRNVSAFDDSATVVNFSGLIQTDAAINFGNSGGPLVDLSGAVIGMNSAVADSANGIGFAIPVNDIKPVLSSVEEFGEIVRPVLGVRFVMLTGAQSEEMGVEGGEGALVVADDLAGGVIDGGAADSAGVRDGDVILRVNDIAVTEEMPLQKVVRAYVPGDEVVLSVWREGEVLEIEVELGSSKDL